LKLNWKQSISFEEDYIWEFLL